MNKLTLTESRLKEMIAEAIKSEFKHINESLGGYPWGAEYDSRAPWNQKDTDHFAIDNQIQDEIDNLDDNFADWYFGYYDGDISDDEQFGEDNDAILQNAAQRPEVQKKYYEYRSPQIEQEMADKENEPYYEEIDEQYEEQGPFVVIDYSKRTKKRFNDKMEALNYAKEMARKNSIYDEDMTFGVVDGTGNVIREFYNSMF